MCDCGNNIESTIHFFLHFANFTTQGWTLMNKIHSIDANILAETEASIIQTLLFRKKDFKNSLNSEIMKAIINRNLIVS